MLGPRDLAWRRGEGAGHKVGGRKAVAQWLSAPMSLRSAPATSQKVWLALIIPLQQSKRGMHKDGTELGF